MKKERLFKRLVWLLVVIFIALGAYAFHVSYKKKTEVARSVFSEVQNLQKQGAVFQAVQKLSTLSDKDFWYLWTPLSNKVTFYEAPFYYEFSKRFWNKGAKDEAAFWMMLGRYRLNYDAARCDSEKALGWKDYFDSKLSSQDISVYAEEDDERFKQILRNVLEWRVNEITPTNPGYFCAFAHQPFIKMPLFADASTWAEIHKRLRLSTLEFLEKGN